MRTNAIKKGLLMKRNQAIAIEKPKVVCRICFQYLLRTAYGKRLVLEYPEPRVSKKLLITADDSMLLPHAMPGRDKSQERRKR
jgi:hypothetical protein